MNHETAESIMLSHKPKLFPVGVALTIGALALAAITAVAQPEIRFRAVPSAEGGVSLEFTGPAPGTYRIEFSDDLRQWQSLITNVLGSTRLTLTNATDRPQRFYRAALLEELPYVPSEVLFRFKPATDTTTANKLTASFKLTDTEAIRTLAMEDSGDLAILLARTTLGVPEAVAAMRANPDVEFAEPNYLVAHMDTANDPKFTDSSLWGMYGDTSSPRNPYGSQAAEAWATGYTGSRQVYVGVIDEGIDVSHPDLAQNIWTNPFEIPGNGIDDDGNGYVDDIHGWDFYHKDNSVFDGSPSTPFIDEHGTHVAGTIGAVGGNALGVAGVNWQVTIISGKFLGPDGGKTSDAILAIDYFTELKRRHGLNIVALNNSWGGGGYSQGLHEAILRAAKANILFIAAAGNYGRNNDAMPTYPCNYDTRQGTPGAAAAGYDAVMSVAMLDQGGNLDSRSHYGTTTVDLAAPGVSILSTVPGDQYRYLSGTSMAAPHVTGAAALYASTHPRATSADIRSALLGAIAPTPALAGRCVTGGRLDLSTVITPAIYVDAAYTGGQPDGTAERPFPTVTQGHAAAQAGDTLRIRANVYRERPLLNKAVRLEPIGGPVRIGP